MFGTYTQFGLSSKYSYNKKLFNCIFHKFDQLQGQFRRSWSYLFLLIWYVSKILPLCEDWTGYPPAPEPAHCHPMRARARSLRLSPAFPHSHPSQALTDCHPLIYLSSTKIESFV